jgi:hypothetical protein
MNRFKYQFFKSLIPELVSVFGSFTIGASGAVASFAGNGIVSITKLATGVYAINFADNFSSFLAGFFHEEGPAGGSAITDGSFVVGTIYQIVTLGTTNWAAIGYPAGLTPTVGGVFVATGVGGAGGGTAKAIVPTGTYGTEIANNPNVMLQNGGMGPLGSGPGAVIIVTTLGPTSTANPTPIPVNAAVGTKIDFAMFFNNSRISV